MGRQREQMTSSNPDILFIHLSAAGIAADNETFRAESADSCILGRIGARTFRPDTYVMRSQRERKGQGFSVSIDSLAVRCRDTNLLPLMRSRLPLVAE